MGVTHVLIYLWAETLGGTSVGMTWGMREKNMDI